MLPPGLIRETSLRKDRRRAFGGTCVHTPLSHTKSNVSFERTALDSAGSSSFIHLIEDDPWRAFPTARSCRDGSTATTLCPFRANHAASRPLPAPTSRTQAGDCGSHLSTGACTFSNETPSYSGTRAVAALS